MIERLLKGGKESAMLSLSLSVTFHILAFEYHLF